jgi:CDP-diacylglycerol pyrophosphatase
MELTAEEWYAPSIDALGTYIDRIPRSDVKCLCGRQKTYTRQQFSIHIKSQCHQKWLASLNDNKANYYVENEKLKDTVRTQQLLLIRLENELRVKTFQLEDIRKRHVETANLLD